jgi:hypothetical protein
MLFLSLVGLFGADLIFSFTPDPMEVTKAVYGTSALGTWTVRACAVGGPVTIQAERLALESKLPIVSRERALEMLSRARRKSSATKMSRALRWTTVAGTLALTTYTRASAKAVALAAGASTLLEGVAREVEAGGPATIAKDEILSGRYTIADGDCMTATAFASKIRGARVIERTLKLSAQ